MRKEERARRLLKAAEQVFGSLDHAEGVAKCPTCRINIHSLHNGPENYMIRQREHSFGGPNWEDEQAERRANE